MNTGVGYKTLKEAVESASSGDVLRLDSDFAESNEINVRDKAITIDLNSKEMTYTNRFRVEHWYENQEQLTAVRFTMNAGTMTHQLNGPTYEGTTLGVYIVTEK